MGVPSSVTEVTRGVSGLGGWVSPGIFVSENETESHIQSRQEKENKETNTS